MKRKLVVLCILFNCFIAVAQNDQWLIYDSNSGSSVSKNIDLNELEVSGYKVVHYSETWQMPPQEVLGLAGNSRFSDMKAATNFIDNEQFPASATVKIVSINSDTFWDRCSGMLVGKKYVLTAAHCVVNDLDALADLKEFVPNLYVKPGYNNGHESKFGNIKVSKTYIFKSYYNGKSKKDIALLELDEPIGEKAGWVAMGFENDRQKVLSTRYFNFSYPMDASRLNLARNVNGDTLCLKTGYPDLVSYDYIGIKSAGIPGESGSLLLAEDDNGFTTYAVRNFSEEKFSFYRLKEEDVLSFYQLINETKHDKTESLNTSVVSTPNLISIYPNPVFEKAIITTSPSIEQIQVAFYDLNNKEVLSTSLNGVDGKFLFENYNLPQGNYFMIARQNNTVLGYTKFAIRK
jgi:hypothetical protein